MKTPPPNDDHVRAAGIVDRRLRDKRFLVFGALVLFSLALGLKSELVSPAAVWWLAAGLVAVCSPVIVAYLRPAEVAAQSGPHQGIRPALEHFVPALLGAVAVAGLSLVVRQWWVWTLAVAAFGAGFAVAARLDYLGLHEPAKRGHHFLQEAILSAALAGAFLAVLGSPFNPVLKLAWIFILAALAAYRSFRVSGTPMAPRRGLLFALLVAQVATFFSWAIFSYAAAAPEGVFAAMLLLAWYINRGVIRHAAEETLNRNVLVEYSLFAALLVLIFVLSLRPPG
ncbi:MAG: hypothetical protein M3Z13_04435 [Candidatus Dormibacteraeota bacterium]|nr:hypothetical protein [Candidatus Dormibacteraeota bacterium]